MPYVTWALVVANIAVFLYQASLGSGLAGLAFVFEYGFVPARLLAEPVAALPTLITHAFLHGGLMHLLGNMLFLFVFGDNVEDRLGHLRYALFYAVGALVAALAQAILGGEPRTPLIGASGAISAVLGAYIVIYPQQRVQTLIPGLIAPWLFVRLFSRQTPWYAPWLPAWAYLGFWAIMQGLSAISDGGGAGEGVAWWAHLGGFAFGMTVANVIARRERRADVPEV